MDLLSLSYDTSSTSLLGGTTEATSTATSSLKTGSLSTGSGDDANISEGASLMGKLSDLQSSDPEKFKEVTQQISDKLTEASGNSSDADEASMLSELAGKFASAASSGSMSSLTASEASASSAQGQVALKYGQAASSGSGTNPMEAASGIISEALAGVETASA